MFRKTFSLLFVMILMTGLTAIWAADQQQAQPEVLTLDQCLGLAYQNSPSLKAAAKSVEIANLQVREAWGSFLPMVNYSVGSTQSNSPLSALDPTQATKASNGTLSLSQKLYSGGVETARYQSAKLNLNNALEEQRLAKEQITFNVKQAYYQVWLAEQMLEVSKSSCQNMEQRYQQEKAFYEVGNASKVDLLQAQVEWESLKPQVINDQNQVDAAKLNLAILLEIDEDRSYTINLDPTKLQLPEKVAVPFETTLADAYQDRPDTREMNNLIEISKLNTKIALAGYKPTVSLSHVLVENDDNTTNFNNFQFNNLHETYTLSLGLSGVLFDGLATQARVAEAKKNEELMLIKDTSTKDQVRIDVELAIQSLSADLAATQASQSNIDLAKESLRLIQAKYDAGMATNLDVTDAQLKLDQALNGYYSGLASYLTAQAKLDMVTGKDN